MNPNVKVHCIKHSYADKTEVSVCGLDFIVYPGAKIALIGANGSGKSTLIYHLLGMLKPTEGKITVLGVNPANSFSKIRKKIGVVVQNVEDQLIGPTVWDDVAFSLYNYGYDKKEIEARVNCVLNELKIEFLKNKIIHYLSGGEKRKVALAGALVLRPKLLILDEMMAEIDEQSAEVILKLLDKYNKIYKTAIILATNDSQTIANFRGLIYLLKNGKIVFKGSLSELEKSQHKLILCRH